ncbi:MAG: type II toxin-antitoxin system HicB family antitoxin [Parcubacteria group bacterium]|nr:type II toxin-antitoxin system HicB family antitoxin [Parcubacteria group bacterium]
MKRLNLKSVVWKEGDRYISQCLNVDVASFGKTKKEALANLDEALSLYFEDVSPETVQNVGRAEIVPVQVKYA